MVATTRTRVLVDAGLCLRELTNRLASIGESPDRLDAVVVTHEHSDHTSGLARLAKKHRVPIYVSRLTAPVIDWEDSAPRLETFQAGSRFIIGDIEIGSFTIPHDAADPVGFRFEAEGVRIGIVTDLGYIPDSIKFHLRCLDLLLIESNHDVDMLRVGPYPWSVKQRVLSRNGHLSNQVVCEYLTAEFDPSSVRTLILGHISEHNNHPEIVRIGAAQVLERRGALSKLVIAEQKRPSEVFQF